jgi:hypothetical protein
MPYGFALGVATSQTLDLPVAGSSVPYWLPPWTVNQTSPLLTTNVCGSRASIAYSVILPVAGSRRPSFPTRFAVYHTPPSGATVMPCGPEPGVGVA